jgi:hypothetical protein
VGLDPNITERSFDSGKKGGERKKPIRGKVKWCQNQYTSSTGTATVLELNVFDELK